MARLLKIGNSTNAAVAEEDFYSHVDQIIDVLTEFPLEGINRKVQIKPLEWATEKGWGSAPAQEKVTKAQLVLKWGGQSVKRFALPVSHVFKVTLAGWHVV